MKKSLQILLMLLVPMVLAGCSGYTIGDTGHPQIKTIAVGRIFNETDEPRLAITMTEMLKERIRQDGTYRLVHTENADVIISGTLSRIAYRAAGAARQADNDGRDERNDDGYRIDLYRTTLTFKHEFITRKGWNVFGKKSDNDRAQFAEGLDQIQDRREALRRAAHNLSRKVIANIAEAW